MLTMTQAQWNEVVAHSIAGLPHEACGLISGPAGSRDRDDVVVERFYPCRNDAASAKVYTLNPKDHLRADRDAEDLGMELVGVVHSHTHTDAYPSPTDVAQAPDPTWHYVIVSLRDESPSVRSFRIVDGVITEEPVELTS